MKRIDRSNQLHMPVHIDDIALAVKAIRVIGLVKRRKTVRKGPRVSARRRHRTSYKQNIVVKPPRADHCAIFERDGPQALFPKEGDLAEVSLYVRLFCYIPSLLSHYKSNNNNWL